MIGTTTLRVEIEGNQPEESPTKTLAPPAASPYPTVDPPSSGLHTVTESRRPPLAAPPAQLAIPGYETERELGRGGMGVVYKAIHRASGEAVAIKTILPAVKPTERDLQKFLRETEILRRLSHPLIVRYRDSGSAGDLIWFAMEYVPSCDVQRLLTREGPLPVRRAVPWALQLLEALGHAHQQGFVHRDVKPANLLASKPDQTSVVKLSDFGLARAYESSSISGLTMTGVTGGTPLFMPPEQILDLRSVRPAADQYSASATLYMLLTGQPIYPPGAPSDLFRRILQDEPIPIAARRNDLPPGLCDAIQRALSRRQEARFRDVGEFAGALRPFL